MTTLLADPAKMIAKGAPHIIHNDKELEAYTNALFQLTALEKPSPAQAEAIELLTLLIERYEQGALSDSCIRCHFRCAIPDRATRTHTARSDSRIWIRKRCFLVSGGRPEAHCGADSEIEFALQTPGRRFHRRILAELQIGIFSNLRHALFPERPSSPGTRNEIANVLSTDGTQSATLSDALHDGAEGTRTRHGAIGSREARS